MDFITFFSSLSFGWQIFFLIMIFIWVWGVTEWIFRPITKRLDKIINLLNPEANKTSIVIRKEGSK